MKIRLGFVSNSSSSSFIVAFPRWIKHIEQLHGLVIPEAIDTVFRRIKNDRGLSARKLINLMEKMSAFYEEMKSNLEILEELFGYDLFDWEWHKEMMEEILELVDGNPDAVIYRFDFGNDAGVGEDIEFMDPFRNLPHIYRNHH